MFITGIIYKITVQKPEKKASRLVKLKDKST